MTNNLKTARFKAGLAGTSCAGKTTLAYGIVSRLKSYGVLAEGVFSQDRKFSFDRRHLETSELAQNWMITNMVAKETEMSLHGDTDVLISDRTALDFFAYYRYQYLDSPLADACWQYVKAWCTTYDVIYLMEPLPYQADGKRPDDEFRMAVGETLSILAREIPNAVTVPRDKILNDLLLRANIMKPNVKNRVTEDDVRLLAAGLNRPVALKRVAADPDVLADHDMYVLVDNPLDLELERGCQNFAINLFGQFCKIELHLTSTFESLDERFFKFYPPGTVYPSIGAIHHVSDQT